jgi:hypothetical protein
MKETKTASASPLRNATDSTSIAWALNQFRYFDGEYKRDAMEFALANREAIIPELLSILEDVLAHTDRYLTPEHEHDEDGQCMGPAGESVWSHMYAVTLLSHFKEPRAHVLIAKLFALPSDICNELLGDTITEDLPALLYSTYPGSPDAIKGLIMDSKADEYCRGSAANALAYAVAGGLLDRKEVLDYLAGLLDGARSPGEEGFWSQIASVILDLYPSDHMVVIRRAFDRGVIDESMIDLECFTEELEKSSPTKCLKNLRKEMAHRMPENIHGRLEKWAGFQEDWEPHHNLVDDFALTPIVRDTEKTGRNDPCPCGSGKKYKKCCLH